jgi:hypothetical protein
MPITIVTKKWGTNEPGWNVDPKLMAAEVKRIETAGWDAYQKNFSGPLGLFPKNTTPSSS